MTHDIAVYLDRARSQFVAAILGNNFRGSGSSKLALAFNTVSYVDTAGKFSDYEAGAGVLKVAAASVTLALALFARDRCIAVSDCVLSNVGDGGLQHWTDEEEKCLNGLRWRYLGLPNA